MKPKGVRTTIAVQGARVHNLKNVSVEIPRDSLVVVTGLSGSGKSSLAFDTIYAEGQRRYMESLSSYAKRFVAQVSKPDVDYRVRPLAGHLDRAEDAGEQSALDRRHDDGYRELSESPVRHHRSGALPAHRRGDAEPKRQPDPRVHPLASRGRRGGAARAGLQDLRRGSRLRLHRNPEEGLPAADRRRQADRPVAAGRARRIVGPAHGRGGRQADRQPEAREGDQGGAFRDVADRRRADAASRRQGSERKPTPSGSTSPPAARRTISSTARSRRSSSSSTTRRAPAARAADSAWTS